MRGGPARELVVIDRTGRLVHREVIMAGIDRTMLNLPDGLYLVRLEGHRPVRVVIQHP